jgi:hypothetical protein
MKIPMQLHKEFGPAVYTTWILYSVATKLGGVHKLRLQDEVGR